MKAAELIERRQTAWRELENLCDQLKSPNARRDLQKVSRFAMLYRDACADLALASAHQLPPKTIDYLHSLVARSHNQLYRSRVFRWREWFDTALTTTPRMIFREPCVHVCTVLFWGLFLISAFLAWDQSYWPTFAEDVLGSSQTEMLENSFSEIDLSASATSRSIVENSFMAGFYVWHNPAIGLTCFVMMLLILPGIVILSYNAVILGASFGFMLRPELGEAGANFQNFVTAHGPFELTAVVLAAGAGLKIGLSWLYTQGRTRQHALTTTARESLPIILCSVACFCIAAVIEGFISPMSAAILPWWAKGLTAVVSCTVLMTYFIVQGADWSD